VTSGVEAAFKILMRKKKYEGPFRNIICVAGDGGSVDIGRQAMSAVTHRSKDALLICRDSESCANAGIRTSFHHALWRQHQLHAPGREIPEGKTLFPKPPFKLVAGGYRVINRTR
jgi:pyruvate ferredoxin oxidoreductase beta subunit/oxalate oxidoreductase subunit beta